MSQNTVLLVDETKIALSYETTSVYLNERCILEVDEDTVGVSPSCVANEIAEALGTEVRICSLDEAELAESIADKMGERDIFADIDDKDCSESLERWLQGYSRTDVLNALKFHAKI